MSCKYQPVLEKATSTGPPSLLLLVLITSHFANNLSTINSRAVCKVQRQLQVVAAMLAKVGGANLLVSTHGGTPTEMFFSSSGENDRSSMVGRTTICGHTLMFERQLEDISAGNSFYIR